MHNALIPFRKYSDFSGRASPREFWWFFALSAAVLIITVFLTGVSAETAAKATPTWALAYVFWWAVTAVPWFALQVRRFHDQGRSGWLVSINIAGYAALFIQPLAGMALLAISLGLMALRGERVRNRYGEAPEVANAAFDPVGASTEHHIQTASEQPIRDRHGVLRLPDGTFECAGLAFASYKEAYQFGLTEGRRSTRRPSEADSGARRDAAIEPQPDERSLPGLDAAHSHVLLKLSEQPVEAETFDTLCREQRLLPDGAIETINDWAFDALDDIAIECEDIVSIQPHLIDKIRSMAAA